MSSDDVCSIRTLTFISRGNYILYATLNDTGEGDTIGLYDVRTKSPVDDTVSMSCGGLSFVSGIHDNEAFLSHTNGALSRSRLETGDMRIECAPVNLKLNTSSHDYATFIDLCNNSNLLAAGGWYSGGGRIIITDVNNIHSTWRILHRINISLEELSCSWRFIWSYSSIRHWPLFSPLHSLHVDDTHSVKSCLLYPSWCSERIWSFWEDSSLSPTRRAKRWLMKSCHMLAAKREKIEKSTDTLSHWNG